MQNNEIQYFTEACKFAQGEFYIDAIQKFQQLINEFSNSDLADDAMYNIGLCFYQMNQFEKSIEIMEELIIKYPDATVTALEDNNEFGKTAAKAYYLIVQCYIGLGDIRKAESYIPILEKYTNTYVVKNSEKFSFAQLAVGAIDTYTGMMKKE